MRANTERALRLTAYEKMEARLEEARCKMERFRQQILEKKSAKLKTQRCVGPVQVATSDDHQATFHVHFGAEKEGLG